MSPLPRIFCSSNAFFALLVQTLVQQPSSLRCSPLSRVSASPNTTLLPSTTEKGLLLPTGVPLPAIAGGVLSDLLPLLATKYADLLWRHFWCRSLMDDPTWICEDSRLTCGYSSFRGKRSSMEDFYDIRNSTVDGQTVNLFGIFDGHGGSRAAEYLKEHLLENLINHPEFITDTRKAICETYKKTDSDFLDSERNTYRDDGSTASTAVLVGNHLFVANVGDSRAVISKAGKAVPLSDDHKPNRSDERKRIEDAGGVVMWAGTWRVGGVLAMSRAFGNRLLKQYVVADPEIQEDEVGEDMELMVLASDGLWDVVENEDAITLARTEEEPEAAARKLTETAFSRGSADNITCIVVRFHHDSKEPAYPSDGHQSI